MPTLTHLIAAALLFAPPPPVGQGKGQGEGQAPGQEAPGPGTPAWHYSPFNTSMKAGHKRIRAWRAQIEAERRAEAETKLQQLKAATPQGGETGFEAPPPMGSEHSFADGRLRGTWAFNRVTHETSGDGYGAGVRLDRTVYDPVHNKLFALTTERNLVEAPFEHQGVWETRNQAIKIEKTGFAGVVVPAGAAGNNEESFRLIGAIDSQLCYSDDEGLNWTFAIGGEHAWYGASFVGAMANGDILAQVRIADDTGARHEILRSRDYGESYETIASWDDVSTGKMVSTRLYNTDDTVIVVRQDDDNDVWEVYRYDGEALPLLTSFDSVAVPRSITGTSFAGEKIYVGATGGGGYYSDGGLVWEWREFLPDRIETVHPNAPDVLFSHEPQHDYSLDGGWTWTPYPNQNLTIGWDPKHLTFHEIDGEWVFVGANDMGLCFNEDPLDNSSWQYINEQHTFGILHGGVSVDHRGLTFTANQDPGTFELVREAEHDFAAVNLQGADGLRVTTANDGRGVWFRHYWTDYYHAHAAFTGDDRVSALPVASDDWYTPPFVSSQLPDEDSIYVSGYDKLFKLVYHSDTNWIQRLELPTDFGGATGSVTYGIDIAKSDPSRFYVSTKSGRFFYSKDYGETWFESEYNGVRPDPSNLPYNQSAGMIIEVADQNPDLVYWGAGGGEAACLISQDGGKTFISAVDGLPPNEALGALSLSPDGQVAFSANYYVYDAPTNKWHEMKGESMPTGAQPAALGVNYLPLQNRVRYFTWGAGVVDFELSLLDLEGAPTPSFDDQGCYTLRAQHTQMALSADADTSADPSSGSPAQQRSWADEGSQKWQFVREGGYFALTNYESGDRLAVAPEQFDDGAPARVFADASQQNSHWNLLREADDSYVLASRDSGKALSVDEASQADHAPLNQWTYSALGHQKWAIEPVSCEPAVGETGDDESGDAGDASEGDTSDDGRPQSDGGGSGCSCHADNEGTPAAPAGLMLLWFLARRRRARCYRSPA